MNTLLIAVLSLPFDTRQRFKKKVDAISKIISISSHLSVSQFLHVSMPPLLRIAFFSQFEAKEAKLVGCNLQRKVLRLSKSANACHSFPNSTPLLSPSIAIRPSPSPFIGCICVFQCIALPLLFPTPFFAQIAHKLVQVEAHFSVMTVNEPKPESAL